MALGPDTIFYSCPKCGYKDLHETMRVEAGFMGNEEDFAVYLCQNSTCSHIFDYITEPHTKEN